MKGEKCGLFLSSLGEMAALRDAVVKEVDAGSLSHEARRVRTESSHDALVASGELLLAECAAQYLVSLNGELEGDQFPAKCRDLVRFLMASSHFSFNKLSVGFPPVSIVQDESRLWTKKMEEGCLTMFTKV